MADSISDAPSAALAAPSGTEPSQGEPPRPVPQQLPLLLRHALDGLLSRAPGHLFPRARRLYFNKYPLEGPPDELEGAAFPSRFRTFVLRDVVNASGEGDPPDIQIASLAVVHWQSPQTDLQEYAAYIRQNWQLEPEDLELMEEPWFRDGGACACLTLIPPSADPAPAEAAPDSSS